MYAEIASELFPDLSRCPETERASSLIDQLQVLSQELGVAQRLRDVGIPEDALATLASDAMKQTRLLVNNPRKVTESDALAIYQAAY
nr:iron-containing alcohol dehydrogenase [Burkholderia multivorans]